MRIGQVNKDNYMEFMRLFNRKSSKTLDNLWGKNNTAKKETSWEEIEARLIASGHLEEGMHIREGDDSWKKIVPVSDEIKEKLIETVRRQFLTNGNGMSEARDGNEIGAIS